MTVMELTPLTRPDYQPKHPPVDGKIPDVVARWGKASQLRWFRRFWKEIGPLESLGAFWCTSEHHRGPCCPPCQGEDGGVVADGYCCCQDTRGPGVWGA